jgi:hypothetical protein
MRWLCSETDVEALSFFNIALCPGNLLGLLLCQGLLNHCEQVCYVERFAHVANHLISQIRSGLPEFRAASGR